ncbi:nucleoside 2-deoxyribosyltransferase [Staphylococcus equorum]|uniref:Nucleoside 2-deoxyribosyltransferase n=1 Tax=Staphylococcus equorum TaxID=246432 RepID=A0A9X4R1Y7_9STAP|nr:nucleoside 2-deoxyribosyltransferase [Staphylococcus equorum]MDG0860397.1 nucleoside 2-deoxyribosyltransferase [Staphylococcus equorum]
MKMYLANGLFSYGDRLVNKEIASRLRQSNRDLDLYVPQENNEINDKSKIAGSMMISKADSEELLKSDVLIAVLDGVEIDSGVAAEIGLFSSLGKPIIGLCTDIRLDQSYNVKKSEIVLDDPIENQYLYRNLFVVGLIKNNGVIVSSIEDLVFEVQKGHLKSKDNLQITMNEILGE